MLFSLMEFSHQSFLRAEPVPFTEPLSVMSQTEFNSIVNSKERKLVVLDDLVLDVTDFANSHPGGRFVLEANSGRDISKFFYGGYNYEPLLGSKNHTHSNYARRVVNSLVVARLEQKRGTALMNIEKVSKDDQVVGTFKFTPVKEIEAKNDQF